MASTCEYDYVERLVFIAEWWDPDSAHLTKFHVNYYPYDNSVELWETTKNRIFLRRSLVDGLTLQDMFVGNTIRVYGRQLNIVEYGDEKTRKLVSKKTEKTLALIKPTVMKDLGPILTSIIRKGFKLVRAKMCNLTSEEAIRFYEPRKADSFLPFLIDHISSGPVLALELVGEDTVKRWLDVIGPEDPAQARRNAPDSLRAIYGQELVTNGFHGAENEQEAQREINYFFPKSVNIGGRPPKTTANFKNRTCCVIKPHILDSGAIGEVITDIMSNGFKVTALEIFYLSNANAEELLEVYKGVVTDFNALLLSFVDGPCIALEIGLNEAADPQRDVYKEFRAFCGPADPDVARQIRPRTLRAKYGVDKFRNGVHCTDLPDDTQLELEYFFKLLEI